MAHLCTNKHDSSCPDDADEGLQSTPTFSAAQRSSGIASTNQPSQHCLAQYTVGATPKQVPHTQELQELFAVLSSWLSLSETRHGLASWDL